MDSEFINVYIETLTKNLHDLQSKNIMFEARLTMAEKIVANLTEENEKQRIELDKLKKKGSVPGQPAEDF